MAADPRRWLVGPLILAGSFTAACDEPADPSGPSPVERPPSATPADGPWGVAAYDAVLAVRVGDRPLLHAIEPERWIDRAEAATLAVRLEEAAAVDPAGLSPRARVALQNDAWGLFQRVSALPSSSPTRARIADGAAALVRRLALDEPPASDGTPDVIGRLLPEEAGWRDVEAELPVFGHERLFGLRRLFTVRIRGGAAGTETERALYSTLVAIDAEGRPRLTDVVGDLEVLRFDGEALVEAHLFELDRGRLRRDGPLGSILEVERAAHVPGLGADGFLATFDPPAALADLPCARCHDDAFAMTLPSDALEPGRRHRALLDQLAPRARALGLPR